jgi:glucose/arabinose dehydrogenase
MERLGDNKERVGRHLFILILALIFTFILARGINTRAAEGLDPAGFLPIVLRPQEISPPPTSVSLVPFATGVSPDVTDIAHAGDGRLFVADKDGIIYVVTPDGQVLDTPFLDIQNKVKVGNWEEGLLGIAFHPNYAQNGYFFVHYTGYPNHRVKITRFTVSADPNVADPNSEVVLLSIGKPSPVHNGGDITFGPDGYLYIPIGDGGPDPEPPGDPDAIEGDPSNHGQRIDELLANILRIDVDNNSGIPPECENSAFYSIPPDNPFVGGPGCDEIWSIGFRNPWRMSFDRQTGDMFIGDVGEWEYEEIDYEPAGTPGGGNYGWHCFEGTYDYTLSWPSVADDCPNTNQYIFPVAEYRHNEGCSVIGGFVYRGTTHPTLRGHYVFADFCTGNMFLLSPNGGEWLRTQVATNVGNITTFGEGADGELYTGMHFDDTIYRVVVP